MEYTCEFKRENGNVNKHVNNFTCRFLSKYSLWVLLPFWADTAHLHTHTHRHTEHTSIIIPLPCASWIFPWHGAISSSNKKPASLKLVSLLANYTEAPGRTGKTSGTSFTGHYSDPTTETTQTHSPSHVNQAFQDVTLTTGGVSLCDFFLLLPSLSSFSHTPILLLPLLFFFALSSPAERVHYQSYCHCKAGRRSVVLELVISPASRTQHHLGD